MSTSATMYNKHTPVLEVTLDANGKADNVGKVLNEKLLPLRLRSNLDRLGEAMGAWQKSRSIPDERTDITSIRQSFPEFEKLGGRNRFSLSDHYWFKTLRGQSWEELNFFTNRYDPIYGEMIFSPSEIRSWKKAKQNAGRSPDITTGGKVKKRWLQDEEPDENGIYRSYLLKASEAALHQDVMSEILASSILDRIGLLDHVHYDMVIHRGYLCTRCENFVTPDEEFVSADEIYRQNRSARAISDKQKGMKIYDLLGELCRKENIPEEEIEKIDLMIGADMLLGNMDRNLANFGFMRNVETGEYTRFAPLFDNAYEGLLKKKNDTGKKNEKPSKLFSASVCHYYYKKLLERLKSEGRLDRFEDIEDLKESVMENPKIDPQRRKAYIRQLEQMQKKIFEDA